MSNPTGKGGRPQQRGLLLQGAYICRCQALRFWVRQRHPGGPLVVDCEGADLVGPLKRNTAAEQASSAQRSCSADPVGAGLVASLWRPSGNAAGFSSFEYSIGGKWLEFLKQIAPTAGQFWTFKTVSARSGSRQF